LNLDKYFFSDPLIEIKFHPSADHR